ncbi:TPA: carbamoyltransferase [Klebsiella aerogenes]
MLIVGVSALNHDSACCIIENGEVIAAVEEERFSRKKHDPRFPYASLEFCLRKAGKTYADIDCISFYENEKLKRARQLWSAIHAPEIMSRLNLDGESVVDKIRTLFGNDKPVKSYSHHMSHAAAARYLSGFNDCAILINDGVGEWETTTMWDACGGVLNQVASTHFPHSVGLFYATITGFLGFNVNNDEYKVMGLASYGKPALVEKLREIIKISETGQIELDLAYFDFCAGVKMYSEKLSVLLGFTERPADSPLSQVHYDLASSAQYILEEVVVKQLQHLKTLSPSKNLCLAGGVALNCVANATIRRSGLYENVFIPPAAGDSGGAIGAAFLAAQELYDKKNIALVTKGIQHCFWGPCVGNHEIVSTLNQLGIGYQSLSRENCNRKIAADLADGYVVGIFRGASEFGPRALGARSIIADPRNPHAQDRVNLVIKQREKFRPFAPVVLNEYKHDYFDCDFESPYMTEVCPVKKNANLPAVTHIDGTARIQTVNIHDGNHPFVELLKSFYDLTNCPVLLNTSFNLRGEPIVNTIEQALSTFIHSEMDALILENHLIYRENIPLNLANIRKPILSERDDEARTTVYTFF